MQSPEWRTKMVQYSTMVQYENGSELDGKNTTSCVCIDY